MMQSRSALGNFSTWETKQIMRVEMLSDEEIYDELKAIMGGLNYSWNLISQRIRGRLHWRALVLEDFEPGNIAYEWNILCDERISWARCGRPSFRNFKFNRACLTKLKILPTQAGLGLDGRCGFLNFKLMLKALQEGSS